MNRKHLFILVFVSLLIAAFFYLSKSKWIKKEIIISSTSLEIQDYITDPEKIKQWLSMYNDSATIIGKNYLAKNKDSLTILNSNLIKTEWQISTPKQINKYIFKILPNTNGTTSLSIYYKTTNFNELLQQGKATKDFDKISYIKKFLESPKLQYGIDVEEGKVKDTFFVVLNTMATKSTLQKNITDNYATLIAYAQKNNLGYYGTKLIHETPLDSNKIQLYTAIAISKTIDTKNENGIKFSQMPKGNMLYCKYSGTFGLREKTIKQFLGYAKKNKYQTMALPFEKITDTAFQFDPLQKVDLTICFPTY